MFKFTSTEKSLISTIVANLSIKRIPDPDIIKEIYNQTNKAISRTGIYKVKKRVMRESYQWYQKMCEGEYEYIYEFRERIAEVMNLQKRHHTILDSPTEPTTEPDSESKS